MNFEVYEKSGQRDYAKLAQAVANVLSTAIRATSGLKLQQVQHRAKDAASLQKNFRKLAPYKAKK
jgi:hypothetical protein